MNAYLKDMLDREARSVQPPRPPIDGIVGAGQAQVRRRRVVVGACAAAVALVAVAVPLAVQRHDSVQPAGPSINGLSLDAMTTAWADASTIHFGTAETDRPQGLIGLASTRFEALYVTMPDASAPLGPESPQSLTALDPSGSTHALGPITLPTVATDPAGNLAAWTRPAGSDAELVVYDTQSSAVIATRAVTGGSVTSKDAGIVVTIRDDTVYYEDAGTVWAWQPTTDQPPTRVDTGPGLLVDVGVGTYAIVDLKRQQLSLVDTDGTTVAEPAGRTIGQFDPSGAYVLALGPLDGQQPELGLLDSQTGADVPLAGLVGTPILGGWDASGVLVVETVEGDAGSWSASSPTHIFGCEPTIAQCSELVDQPMTLETGAITATTGYLGLIGLSAGYGDSSSSSSGPDTQIAPEAAPGPSVTPRRG